MKMRSNTFKAIFLCSLLLVLLVACTFPDEGNPSANGTTESSVTDAATVATLGTVTKPVTSATAAPTTSATTVSIPTSSVTDTTARTTEATTVRGPIDDGFPNETEDGDTKRY